MSAVDVQCEQVSVTLEERILKVVLNRPEKKNALTQQMYTAIVAALHELDRNDEARCLYITGVGNVFTSGNDVMDFMMNPPDLETSAVANLLRALPQTQKPLIASVNGIAIGIGTTLLLHCDLAYAAESAVFQTPFANLGLCPEAGSSYLMPALMGHARAAEWLLLGEKLSASKAREHGIINDVFPDADLQDLAWAKALQLAAQPPGAVRLSKRLMKQHALQVLPEVMMTEGREFGQRLTCEEAGEAFSAFAERRKPDFSRFI